MLRCRRAGQNAAQRTIDVLLKEDVQVRIARIPAGRGPRQPAAQAVRWRSSRRSCTRRRTTRAPARRDLCEQEDIASPRGRGVAAAQRWRRSSPEFPTPCSARRFLLEVARRLQVPRAALEEEVRKAEAQMRRAELQQRDYIPSAHERGGGRRPRRHAGTAEPLAAAPIVEATPVPAPGPSRNGAAGQPPPQSGLGGGSWAARGAVSSCSTPTRTTPFESADQFMQRCDERTRDSSPAC